MESLGAKPHNSVMQERRIGVEFEFSAVEMEFCIETITQLFGGKVQRKHSLETVIADTEFGEFRVELDAVMMKDLAAYLEKDIPDQQLAESAEEGKSLTKHLSEMAGSLAGQVVPIEIVTPPIPESQIMRIDELRGALQAHHAEGTKSSFLNAFGLHLNPEVKSMQVEGITATLKAFLVLYPWLKEVRNIDLSRRVLSYIDPFPKDYLQRVLPAQYQPDLPTLMTDYLRDNPTRNRALDMLPLFAYLDESLPRRLDKKTREMVKSRPTYHYRLPNCDMDNPDWRVQTEWEYWLKVEALAENPDKLQRMADEYRRFLDNPLHGFVNDYVEYVRAQMTEGGA